MDHTFDDILAANRAYADDFALAGLAAPARKGVAVLTCMDSRIEPLAMLGLVAGDAKILRNAGARVNDDALRSLVLATNLLEVTRIMIVQHTDCAMAKTSDADLRRTLGSRYPAAHLADVSFQVIDDQRTVLARDIERIRRAELIPADIQVGGFIYDVDTGRLEHVVGD